MEDADKAGRLGGNLPAVAELRSAAGEGMLDRQREDRHAALALAAARRHVENGQFAAGERLLAGLAGQQSQVAVLMDDVATQRETFATAPALAESALARGDVEAAAAEAARASGSRAGSGPADCAAGRGHCRHIAAASPADHRRNRAGPARPGRIAQPSAGPARRAARRDGTTEASGRPVPPRVGIGGRGPAAAGRGSAPAAGHSVPAGRVGRGRAAAVAAGLRGDRRPPAPARSACSP